MQGKLFVMRKVTKCIVDYRAPSPRHALDCSIENRKGLANGGAAERQKFSMKRHARVVVKSGRVIAGGNCRRPGRQHPGLPAGTFRSAAPGAADQLALEAGPC
jgi:hypothetical protein